MKSFFLIGLMYKLYLLNDNIHTFDEVNSMLKRTFAYPSLHAQSIIEIVHVMGECVIKSSDTIEDLQHIQEVILKEGFKLKIEKL